MHFPGDFGKDSDRLLLAKQQVLAKISGPPKATTSIYDLLNNRSFLHRNENTTTRLPVFETGPKGTCNVNNK